MIVEGIPNHERKGAVVRLAASGDRVQVKSGKTVAECEAALWEDGQCTLLWEELVKGLRACPDQPTLTINAHGRQLSINAVRMALISYSASAPSPEVFQVFIASEMWFDPPSL